MHLGTPKPGTCVQASQRLDISESQAKALTERIQDAGTEVVKAKVDRTPSSVNRTQS